ncbi:hypothetical protein [Bordetella bronchialis]|uniref:hypothetical protein n=1 Tax=Bordetella bronchialis TaxID=463025 RepID=UPI0012E9A93C|nr:hypothetical protein [Bordetella bronchialis]
MNRKTKRFDASEKVAWSRIDMLARHGCVIRIPAYRASCTSKETTMSAWATLTTDTVRLPQADGITPHTVTLTLLIPVEAPWVESKFVLTGANDSVIFLRTADNQTLSPDRQTLTMPLQSVTTVKFVCTNPDGDGAYLKVFVMDSAGGSFMPDPPGGYFSFSAAERVAPLDQGQVQIISANGRYWIDGASSYSPYTVMLTTNGTDIRTRFDMRVVTNNQVRFSANRLGLKKRPVGNGQYIFVMEPNENTGTDLLIRDYNPDTGAFWLWDPETGYMCALATIGGIQVPALMQGDAGELFTLKYLSKVPVQPPQSPYTLQLQGNDNLAPQADGLTPHTATAIISKDGSAVANFPYPIIFSLPDDNRTARFIQLAGQTLSADRKEVRAPADPVTGKASVQFVDTATNGEVVAVRATVEMDPGNSSYYLESTPTSVEFTFSRNIGASLDLERGYALIGTNKDKDMYIYEAIAAAKGLGGLVQNLWKATFTLPADSSATFLPDDNQTISANGKVLTAQLSEGTAYAHFQDSKASGEVVAVQAYIENNDIYLPSHPPELDYLTNSKLNLTSPDEGTATLANGVAQHTATVTFEGGDVPADFLVTFKLSPARGSKKDISAWFVDETAGQRVLDNGRTLISPLTDKKASVKFVDDSLTGEAVSLEASNEDLGLFSNILTFDFNDVLKLESDGGASVEADGYSTYGATATLQQSQQEPWDVTFTLPTDASATFVPQTGQRIGDGGTNPRMLIAPLENNVAKVKFVDTNKNGETVKLGATIKNDEVSGGTLNSVPAKVSFKFEALPGALALDLRDNNPNVHPQADGVDYCSATATLVNGTAGKNYEWIVTFSLPEVQSARFVAQDGQTYGGTDGTDRTILYAKLSNNQATARFVDDKPKGETVALNATVANDVVKLPASAVNFTFSELPKLYLSLEGDGLPSVAADGTSKHTATATLKKATINYPWNVTFTLPANKSATFVLQDKQTYGDTAHKVLVAPLVNDTATAQFVDVKGETVGLKADIDYDDNDILPSDPTTLNFKFVVPRGGSFDDPKYFRHDANAKQHDIYQLLGSDFVGTGYIEGAYYICTNPSGVANVMNHPPPALGQPDNDNWAHAFNATEDQYLAYDTKVKSAYIFGNGNHCTGIVLYFNPSGSDGIISPDYTQQPGKYFKQYMETLGFVSRNDLSASSDSSEPHTGFTISLMEANGEPVDATHSLLGPTAYTAAIAGSQQMEPVSSLPTVNANVPIDWCARRYYTSTTSGSTQIGMMVSMPSGVMATYGWKNVDGTAPLPVTVYAYTKYNANVYNGGLGYDGTHVQRGLAFGSDDDNYWQTHTDTNAWSPDFYWRQDNYRVVIRNRDGSSVNDQAGDKKIADFAVDGVSVEMSSADGKPSSVQFLGYTRNYYTTEEYICWSGTPKLQKNLWPGYPITLESGESAGSITLIFLSYVNLISPFSCVTYKNGDSPWLGKVTFHDQYGNPGEFYVNFNLPSTYYPKQYDPSRDSYPRNASIIPIKLGNTQISGFDDVITTNASSPPTLTQSYAYLFSLKSTQWAYLDSKTFLQSPLRAEKLTHAGERSDRFKWSFIYLVPTPPSNSMALYNAGYGGFYWGVRLTVDNQQMPNVFARPEFAIGCVMRPVWTQNGFIMHDGFWSGSQYVWCWTPEKDGAAMYGNPTGGSFDNRWLWRFTQDETDY